MFNKKSSKSLTLILRSVKSLINIIFDARKFWFIFFLAILKTNLFSHHLSKCNFILYFDFSRFSLLSLKRLDRILFKSHHMIFMMYITMSETFIIHCNRLNFQEKPSLRTGQKSALQQSLFRRYAHWISYWCPSYAPVWLVHFSMNFCSIFWM